MPLKTFLVNKTSKKKYVLNGIKRLAELPEKYKSAPTFGSKALLRAGQLPPKVDLRPQLTAVEDQSDIASCVANSLAGIYEYLLKKTTGQSTDVSRLFIYYNGRKLDNPEGPLEDGGCSMTNAIESLEKYGTCLESHWPYKKSLVDKVPNEQAYAEAKQHCISEALRVDLTVEEMKTCLAQGFPFAFGLELFQSFNQAQKAGVVPMPNPGETGREEHGFHAMLAVGYSDQSNAFIVRNSWGEDWGDHGYCYIPYSYIADEKYSFDAWTFKHVSDVDFGTDHWDTKDEVNHTDQSENSETDSKDESAIEVIDDNDTVAPTDETQTDEPTYTDETQTDEPTYTDETQTNEPTYTDETQASESTYTDATGDVADSSDT